MRSAWFIGVCVIFSSVVIALPRLMTKLVTTVGERTVALGTALEDARLSEVREGASATATAIAESLVPSLERQALAADRQSTSIDAMTAAISKAAADSKGRPVEVRVHVVPTSEQRRSTYSYRR